MLVNEQSSIYTSISFFIPLTLILIITYFLSRRKKQEVDCINDDDLIDQWTPEPLVSDLDSNFVHKYIVEKKPGYKILVNGFRCVNFATHNYFSFVEHADVENAAVKCIEKYGVGSCGPRGFYGTIDVHLELEENLAKFMNTEESVVYSYGFSTSASAIFAFVKKNDVVFVDEKINFAIQTGLIACRCSVRYFKHNDMAHLEQLLIEQTHKDTVNRRESKKFIIVEGINMKTGTVCPLKDIIRCRSQYRARLFIDESVSFGVLGRTGRGVTEHFGVSVEEVDMIIGSLEHALASVGGFCVGSSFVIEHHTLSGAGYCFSASLAPFLAVAANQALNLMKADPSLLVRLKENCTLMHECLLGDQMKERFVLEAHAESPVKNLYVRLSGERKGEKEKEEDVDKERDVLERIVEFCVNAGCAVMVPTYLDQEAYKPRPGLRVTCNVNHTREDVTNLCRVLCEAYDSVLS